MVKKSRSDKDVEKKFRNDCEKSRYIYRNKQRKQKISIKWCTDSDSDDVILENNTENVDDWIVVSPIEIEVPKQSWLKRVFLNLF
jgi:hypothetical protein